jgi:hypothetical protein
MRGRSRSRAQKKDILTRVHAGDFPFNSSLAVFLFGNNPLDADSWIFFEWGAKLTRLVAKELRCRGTRQRSVCFMICGPTADPLGIMFSGPEILKEVLVLGVWPAKPLRYFRHIQMQRYYAFACIQIQLYALSALLVSG